MFTLASSLSLRVSLNFSLSFLYLLSLLSTACLPKWPDEGGVVLIGGVELVGGGVIGGTVVDDVFLA